MINFKRTKFGSVASIMSIYTEPLIVTVIRLISCCLSAVMKTLQRPFSSNFILCTLGNKRGIISEFTHKCDRNPTISLCLRQNLKSHHWLTLQRPFSSKQLTIMAFLIRSLWTKVAQTMQA
jgi:hypothetical protein